nr:hypothetical protein [Streptomyces sp. SID5468]
MPDGAVTGIEVAGARTGRVTRYTGRIVDVDNPRHARALRAMGAFTVNIGGRTRSGGYRCPECGFAAYLKTCSRCGGTCTREA